MLKKGLLVVLVMTMVAGLLAGCGGDQDGEGALLDEVVFMTVESPAAAVRQLQGGDIDLYGFDITDPTLFEEIADDPNLDFGLSYGGYSEIRFNTWGPTFDNGMFNPFHDAQIREAMNWLVDRHYIVEEYLGGLGEPKWTFMGKKFPDSAIRYPHIVEEIEDFYAHDPDKAAEVVTERMEALGAELVDGTWHYEGEVIELTALIRADLPPYPEAGDYFVGLLEDLGFEVHAPHYTGAEANPIWTGTHPREGNWNIYTGGWSSPVIPRCSAHTFDQFYTHRVMPWPVFQVLQEPLEADFPELNNASRRLREKDFTTMEEREELFDIALWEAMKFSNQIWICDKAGANPYRADVKTAVDLAGGIGDPAWVWTTHRHEDGEPVGGDLRFAVPNFFVDPWNPVDGSAFTYDNMVNRRALGDMGILPDPRDGLYHGKRAERAEVTMKTGMPVDQTLDWVTLDFADEITVPGDAWADWDAKEQRFITVDEKYPDGVTALRKSVVYYPDDIFDHPLHDGSTLSVGDFVMGMIVYFDRGKEDSPIFDLSYQAELESSLNMFRGVRIVSTEPLIIETYSDLWYLDAEVNATTWWPVYGTYDWSGFWHMITVGKLADAARELAFSNFKSDELGVGWMDYTKGESLPILEKHMNQAAEENYIPYASVLGEFISEDEAAERWANIQAFYEEHGHFWVGAGPYVLKSVHPIETTAVLEGFADYPDPPDQWFFMLGELEME
ncbi:MAG: ABC transporter substrate-binding protein [Firmicutes bacterium]|nr:ABC transporter substrate-binding protein [Bacillota bacterium]